MIVSGDEVLALKSGQVEFIVSNDKRTVGNVGTTPAICQVIRVTSAKTPK